MLHSKDKKKALDKEHAHQPSRHLNYYTGYNTITQNSAGDITMRCINGRIHFYASNMGYECDWMDDEGDMSFENYIGTVVAEVEYTL